MSFLSRLFGTQTDPRERLRPLWHRVVEISREPHWYSHSGAADTVAGRFDMIVAVLVLVLLRLEKDRALAPPAALLTELFVEDMDGQLRESGVGDLMVGKHMGRLMGVLGGRLGAFRSGLAGADDAQLAMAVDRNVTLLDGADPTVMARELRKLAGVIAATPESDLLEGRIAR